MAEIMLGGRPVPAIAVALVLPGLALAYTVFAVAVSEEGVMARNTMITEKELGIEEKRAELEELKKRTSEIATIKNEIKDIERSITLLKQKIPGEAQVPVLLFDIEKIARDSQLQLNSFSPSPLQPFGAGASGSRSATRQATTAAAAGSATSDISELPVKVSATATFPQVIKLLHQLNAYERKLNVSGLTVKPESGKTDTSNKDKPLAFKNNLTVEFTLSAYVLKQAGVGQEDQP